ncbi:hypothetical protein [Flavihumibacter solisilvae]|uniref:Uncharacterized protein n=1 Tax=Flavihumibacter solisilvae TaxID=1349421 RepID=A0A0C1LAQ5_9BACT|nr:hypothetical protein [Flavihumibacter solisilvae]KIC92603.1 hypothetical protein OI18_21950 [Flavihumibacter solisilvae]
MGGAHFIWYTTASLNALLQSAYEQVNRYRNPGFRAIFVLLLIVSGFGCNKDDDEPQPEPPPVADSLVTQSRTATYLNSLGGWPDFYVNAYPEATAEDVAVDDDKFASTYELDTDNWYASLSLQGFEFNIPENATIKNIIVKVRRFKKGSPAIGDNFLTLMQRYNCDLGICVYGVHWTDQDSYSGKVYPDNETEYIFSQPGSGYNGGYFHNESYLWTPAIINKTFFGVRIDVSPPVGAGKVKIYYDQVTVTVEYLVPR